MNSTKQVQNNPNTIDNKDKFLTYNGGKCPRHKRKGQNNDSKMSES